MNPNMPLRSPPEFWLPPLASWPLPELCPNAMFHIPPASADAPPSAADFKIVLRGTPFTSRIEVSPQNHPQLSGCDAIEAIRAACERLAAGKAINRKMGQSEGHIFPARN
jgi:hypothetical protein